jgi:hypothetical protein
MRILVNRFSETQNNVKIELKLGDLGMFFNCMPCSPTNQHPRQH